VFGLGSIVSTGVFISIGGVNIPQKVKGAQIGKVNLRKISTIALGLFNYSHTGRLVTSNWINDSATTGLTLSSGSRNIYSLYSAGISRGQQGPATRLGIGIGARMASGRHILEAGRDRRPGVARNKLTRSQ